MKLREAQAKRVEEHMKNNNPRDFTLHVTIRDKFSTSNNLIFVRNEFYSYKL